MLNYKRLVPRTLAASVYVHNNEKLTNGESDKINDGSFGICKVFKSKCQKSSVACIRK